VPTKRIPIPWDRYSANGPVKMRAASAMADTMQTMALMVPAISPGTKSDITESLFIFNLIRGQKFTVLRWRMLTSYFFLPVKIYWDSQQCKGQAKKRLSRGTEECIDHDGHGKYDEKSWDIRIAPYFIGAL